jgi:phosphate/sulfate permease
MLGAAYSRLVSAINARLVGEAISLWVLAPLAAFGLAFAVEVVL